MRISQYSASKEESNPSTSFIAIRALCTTIQFADCKTPENHINLSSFSLHTPKKSHFFFLMFKLKFEAYIFPKFNTEPQLNRRIVKFFSHIELTLTTLFKLLLSFLSTIFSGTKHGIRKNKENNFQRESENLATFVSGLGRRAFESSFQSFDWFRPAMDQKSKFSYFFGISQFTV